MPGFEPARNPFDPDRPLQLAVTVEGDGTRLMREGEDEDEVVCEAPCGELYDISKEDSFYIDGDGMPTSAVPLQQATGDITLTVDPGNSAARTAGIILAVTGFAGTIAMASFTIVEWEGLSYWPPEPEPFGTAIGAGAGLLVGVAGTVLAALMGTEVTLGDGSDTATRGWTWRF
jgi:hypothetical protein